jgi:hypothetical protein
MSHVSRIILFGLRLFLKNSELSMHFFLEFYGLSQCGG